MKKYVVISIVIFSCSCNKKLPVSTNHPGLTAEILAGDSGRTWSVLSISELYHISIAGSYDHDSTVWHSKDSTNRIYFTPDGGLGMRNVLRQALALDSTSHWLYKNSYTIVFSSAGHSFEGNVDRYNGGFNGNFLPTFLMTIYIPGQWSGTVDKIPKIINLALSFYGNGRY